jgi:hypothetical protein
VVEILKGAPATNESLFKIKISTSASSSTLAESSILLISGVKLSEDMLSIVAI